MNKENQPCLENRQTYEYTFTVFTSTYNRAYSLDRVYESLKMQTYRSFEWLIFDNSSTDNTRDLIKHWQQDTQFTIRYIYSPENLGFNLGFNRGVREAKGELFLPLDSDDACFPNALERFKFHWDSIPIDRKDQFSSVSCLCQNETGKLIGKYFLFNPTDSDSLEISYRFKVTGEKWGFTLTEVLRKFPYPETLEKGTHISANFIWHQIARHYKTRFVNEILKIYWLSPDSISRAKPNLPKTAFNKQLYLAMILNDEMDWFRFAPLTFLLNAAHYSRFSFHSAQGISKQIKQIHHTISRILWLIALPLGCLLFLRDNVVYHSQEN